MTARRLAGIAAASTMLVCGPATALDQIADNHWSSSRYSISPTGSPITVTFIAHATALDIASGVTFSIQERDPEGNDKILDVALPWAPPYPAVGTEIRVTAACHVACENDSLVARYVGQWFVTWCDLDLGSQTRYGASGTATHTGTSEPENFEFVLLDENGVEAPVATPEDAYYCAATAFESESPFTSPYELVLQGSSITSESVLGPRGATGIQDGSDGVIQIAFDPNGERTCGQIPVMTASTLYIVARPAGPATRCGITGAELRVVGIPTDWMTTVTPAGMYVGDLLGPVGANVVWSTCQVPTAGPVLLYTISVFATSSVTNHAIEVVARNPPTNPNFQCPLVTLCDMPLYSIVCMSGSQAVVNPSVGATCGLLGVETSTWSVIKTLYK